MANRNAAKHPGPAPGGSRSARATRPSARESHPAYPVMLRIAGKRCVVVGGGKVAERKVKGLLEAGADVLVVAPKATQGIQRLAEAGAVRWKEEMFHMEHLAGALLVIAATNDDEVNEAVAAAANTAAILANVVDSPALCSFYVPACVRRGNLTISVSTSGESPALSASLKRALEVAYGEEYGLFSQLLGELRAEVQACIPLAEDRHRAWQRAVERSDEILALLRSGRLHEARELVRSCLFSHSD